MDIKDLKTLIKMVTETDITEFELENAEEKVVIKRGCAGAVPQFQMPQSIPYQYAPQAQAAPAAAAPAAAPAAVVEEGEAITSPIVGTFYRSPAPDAGPYVEVGKVVEKGEVLCIVEAMKLMNEIKSETAGAVVEILVQNGQTVEYDQPIMKIKKV